MSLLVRWQFRGVVGAPCVGLYSPRAAKKVDLVVCVCFYSIFNAPLVWREKGKLVERRACTVQHATVRASAAVAVVAAVTGSVRQFSEPFANFRKFSCACSPHAPQTGKFCVVCRSALFCYDSSVKACSGWKSGVFLSELSRATPPLELPASTTAPGFGKRLMYKEGVFTPLLVGCSFPPEIASDFRLTRSCTDSGLFLFLLPAAGWRRGCRFMIAVLAFVSGAGLLPVILSP